MDQLFERVPAAMVRPQQRPALILQVNFARTECSVFPKINGHKPSHISVSVHHDSWLPQLASSGLKLSVYLKPTVTKRGCFALTDCGLGKGTNTDRYTYSSDNIEASDSIK